MYKTVFYNLISNFHILLLMNFIKRLKISDNRNNGINFNFKKRFTRQKNKPLFLSCIHIAPLFINSIKKSITNTSSFYDSQTNHCSLPFSFIQELFMDQEVPGYVISLQLDFWFDCNFIRCTLLLSSSLKSIVNQSPETLASFFD